jgi:hypothetical protein
MDSAVESSSRRDRSVRMNHHGCTPARLTTLDFKSFSFAAPFWKPGNWRVSAPRSGFGDRGERLWNAIVEEGVLCIATSPTRKHATRTQRASDQPDGSEIFSNDIQCRAGQRYLLSAHLWAGRKNKMRKVKRAGQKDAPGQSWTGS